MSQIRFHGCNDISEPGLDGKMYRVSFSIVDTEETQGEVAERKINIDIGISGTLMAVWGISRIKLPQVATALAAENIKGKLESGNFPERIVYHTMNAPDTPPPGLPPNYVLHIAEKRPKEVHDTTPLHISIAAEHIANLRDEINAISTDLYGDKLLLLESERAIVDVYKPARNQEEFQGRLLSLAQLATGLNKEMLEKQMPAGTLKNDGSIYILELFLKAKGADDVSAITDPLYNINNLRRSYPTHHDTANKVMKAYDYFEFKYPLDDFQVAMDKIFGKYRDSLKHLLHALQSLKYPTI